MDTAQLRKVPPEMADSLVRRCEWSVLAMEHSRIGPIEFAAPGAPFHHLSLPLERVPLRFGLHMDGSRQYGRNAPNTLTAIEAGAGGTAMWDADFESACFYFTTDALCAVLGCETTDAARAVRTRVELHAPALVRLLHALHADAAKGQPHGAWLGDAIFVALAAALVMEGEHRRVPARAGEYWRVRRALEYIHAHLTERLNIAGIATAAGTSPFYLNRAFRAALGSSIWQYVSRERARYGAVLMRDPRLNLTMISQLAGFDTYASFIASARSEYGVAPAQLRRALAHS